MTAETTTVNEPNATLYVSNIDWKIKKPILKRALHTLFSRHGKVLEIITLRKEGLRGQAWVIFSSIATATAALQAEQNFTFFDKNLIVQYAKEKSDRVAKLDGTFVPKDRRQKKLKRDIDEVKGQQQQQQQQVANIDSKKIKLDGSENEITMDQPVIPPPPSDEVIGTSVAAIETLPSNILFAEALPKDCNEMMLACLFRSYPGYKEVRIPRPGLAFIEFDDEPHASVALKALNGFSLSVTETLNLKYGKA
mmetsp:Transcript_8210/g.10436  ORF Transcript_8210/g.10436 Transcript_8210/m.10436 type:complete len:251 (+) Transcript_8210:60-812(+)